MTTKKDGESEDEHPAVPPPDNPLDRHRQDSDAADREAARLRLEAILQLRRAPDETENPEGEE